LMRAAQIHAEQMARARRMAHVLPHAAYPNAADRLAAAQYRWQTFGENVAAGQASPAEVVNDWMHSAGIARTSSTRNSPKWAPATRSIATAGPITSRSSRGRCPDTPRDAHLASRIGTPCSNTSCEPGR
jgi:hypothetical protein